MEFILKCNVDKMFSNDNLVEIKGSNLREALENLYNHCKYSKNEKRNDLNICIGKHWKELYKSPHIGFNLTNGDGCVEEIIVIKDNNEKVRIFDKDKYCSPKCYDEILEFAKYLNKLSKEIPNGEY